MLMDKYKIEITETLQQVVEVEAESEEEAMRKVMKMYKNSKVVLDDNNFVDLAFKKL